MEIQWTKHRFSGGLLALDLVNTVVRRNDPARCIDRFGTRENIEAFAQAALRFCGGELPAGKVAMPRAERDKDALIGLRDRIDDYLRPCVTSSVESCDALARLFDVAAVASRDVSERSGVRSFGYYASISAMKLLDQRMLARCKVCPDCDWLFVDQSKNQSRMWCDMTVCGNRAKAKAYYARTIKQKSRLEGMPT